MESPGSIAVLCARRAGERMNELSDNARQRRRIVSKYHPPSSSISPCVYGVWEIKRNRNQTGALASDV